MLARDIERLKAAPAVDFTGMALKLDQLASSVDSWPLLAAVTQRQHRQRQARLIRRAVDPIRVVAAAVARIAERARRVSRSGSHSPC